MERGPGGGLEAKGAADSGAPRKGDLWLPGAAEETDGVREQTASGAWAETAHDKAESKDSGDIIALTVLLGAVCGWQRGGAARAKVLMPWNDDWHSLRQRAEEPLPGCPEHFWRDSSRQRCGGIAARLNNLPWRNSAKYGLARLSGQLIFGTGPTRSCAARGGRKLTLGREISVSFLSSLDTGVHLVGGDPQDAEFCDGPGPGMALEQNSFPAATPTGRVGLILSKVGQSSLT